MKARTKKIIYPIVLLCFFAYGLSVGLYKIFPFPQFLGLKHLVENTMGTFEGQDVEPPAPSGSAEILDTFLQRLLIKKVYLPGFSGHGGGLSTSGDLLFIASNKGSVQAFNLEDTILLESAIADVPMNFTGLIRSGHPYRNDFRIQWFRVNGVFSENLENGRHLLFVSHNAYDEQRDCITHNISRTELVTDSLAITQPGSWETIFTAEPCINPEPEQILSGTLYPGHISGGGIVAYDNQNLLVSIGDYDRHGINGTEEFAMDRSNPYGKFVLVDKETGDWSVYTTGHRNPAGLYIDRDSVIWSVENGPEGGDELNIIEEGENYGWPKVSFGMWYDPQYPLPGSLKTGLHEGYREPAFSWVPSIAPSSIVKIEGDRFEYWAGDLLIGTMRDQSLHRLRLNRQNRVIYNERIYLGHRIRDMIVLPDQQLALTTDDGYLMFIEDGGPVFEDMDTLAITRMAKLAQFTAISEGVPGAATASAEKSAMAIFQQHCSVCHNLDARNHIGPHLQGLLNRQIGGVDDFNYSQTLRNETRSWNTQLLRSFLENPDASFPQSSMQKINLTSSEIDSLLLFFQNQNNQ